MLGALGAAVGSITGGLFSGDLIGSQQRQNPLTLQQLSARQFGRNVQRLAAQRRSPLASISATNLSVFGHAIDTVITDAYDDLSVNSDGNLMVDTLVSSDTNEHSIRISNGTNSVSVPFDPIQEVVEGQMLSAETMNQIIRAINQLMGRQSTVNGSHYSQVKKMRSQFKEYSKEDFRKLSKRPLVKEMLTGLATVPAKDVAERIRKHVEAL